MTVRIPPTDNPLYEIAEASEYTWYFKNYDLYSLSGDIELTREVDHIYLTNDRNYNEPLFSIRFRHNDNILDPDALAHIIDKVLLTLD